MSKKLFNIATYLILCIGFTGCSNKMEELTPDMMDGAYHDGAPRLIIHGTVSNTGDETLPGIYVSVFGVREANEPDILWYNYAITDSLGKYTIIRYRGRETPVEVTVVATDSTDVYQEQVLFVPVKYDYYTLYTGEQQNYNGYVNADFTLEAK